MMQRQARQPQWEKPASSEAKEWRTGATWNGRWRAASEKDGYMAGDAYEATPLPKFQGSLRDYQATYSMDSVSVDPVFNCSHVQRPRSYPILDILKNWPPDTIKVPPRHFASLCRFDYQRDRAMAFAYRDAELPFVVRNIFEADETAKKWSTPGFLEKKFRNKKFRTEKSDDNHFMYYSPGRLRGSSRDWVAPTTDEAMTFPDWLSFAKKAYNTSILDSHYYFRASPPDMKPADVPVFSTKKKSLFLKEPHLSKGVHCRFGAAGIIAEAHYDGSRNFVFELGGPIDDPDHPNAGRRRYLIASPDQCANAYLLPKNHPSGRHSEIDWSRPVSHLKFPNFKHLRALEVILEPGDGLYIPHGWLHYIHNLGTNFQCNSRSGRNDIGMTPITQCGF